MHTLLVIFHVVSMIASLAFMSGAIGLGLYGKTTAAKVASVGMIVTAFGAVSGSILLFFSPVLSQCLTLTAYLAGVTILYNFGFGGGFAENARFIRSSAPVQKS